jgi:hypothetical protein
MKTKQCHRNVLAVGLAFSLLSTWHALAQTEESPAPAKSAFQKFA